MQIMIRSPSSCRIRCSSASQDHESAHCISSSTSTSGPFDASKRTYSASSPSNGLATRRRERRHPGERVGQVWQLGPFQFGRGLKDVRRPKQRAPRAVRFWQRALRRCDRCEQCAAQPNVGLELPEQGCRARSGGAGDAQRRALSRAHLVEPLPERPSSCTRPRIDRWRAGASVRHEVRRRHRRRAVAPATEFWRARRALRLEHCLVRLPVIRSRRSTDRQRSRAGAASEAVGPYRPTDAVSDAACVVRARVGQDHHDSTAEAADEIVAADRDPIISTSSLFRAST